jgi:hypothetical protein
MEKELKALTAGRSAVGLGDPCWTIGMGWKDKGLKWMRGVAADITT